MNRPVRPGARSGDRPASGALSATSRSLPIALLRARERVMGPIRPMLADAGVTEQQWRVLRVLDEQGPLELTELAARACLLLPSLTRIARTLEAKGHVLRSPHATDGRRVLLEISPDGRALIERWAPRSKAIAAELEARFGRERLDELLDLLQELSESDL